MAYSVISDSGFSFDEKTFGFSRQELGPTLLNELYANSFEIAKEINDRIRERTAEWTGALREDEVFVPNTDYKNASDPIANFYVDGSAEEAAWGRTYGRFIEGPDLGYSSPTIKSPSHMYAETADLDLPVIEDWAMLHLEAGTEILASLQGITGS